jgi:hypothetical protein
MTLQQAVARPTVNARIQATLFAEMEYADLVAGTPQTARGPMCAKMGNASHLQPALAQPTANARILPTRCAGLEHVDPGVETPATAHRQMCAKTEIASQ